MNIILKRKRQFGKRKGQIEQWIHESDFGLFYFYRNIEKPKSYLGFHIKHSQIMHEISLKNVMRLLVNHKIPIEIIVAKIGYKTVYTKEQLLKTLHNRTQHFLQIENDVKSLLFLSHKQKRS